MDRIYDGTSALRQRRRDNNLRSIGLTRVASVWNVWPGRDDHTTNRYLANNLGTRDLRNKDLRTGDLRSSIWSYGQCLVRAYSKRLKHIRRYIKGVGGRPRRLSSSSRSWSIRSVRARSSNCLSMTSRSNQVFKPPRYRMISRCWSATTSCEFEFPCVKLKSRSHDIRLNTYSY